MKILYYFSNNQSVMFRWQSFHIFDELKRHNCVFKEFYYECFQNPQEANLALVEEIKNNHYDLFMTSFNEKKLFINTLRTIKEHGVKTLLFCPDNLKVPFNHKRICRYFDLTWLTSQETEYLFKRWKANTIFLPYAANPFVFAPRFEDEDVFQIDEINKIGFIGTPYGSRAVTLKTLLDGGVDVAVHTSFSNVETPFINDKPLKYISTLFNYLRYRIGWKLGLSAIFNKIKKKDRKIDLNNNHLSLKDPVELTKLGSVYRQYSLSLSYGSAGSTDILKKPVDVVNLRNFEIPMCGGLQFTRYTKELASYFEEGKEIVFYRSKKDMIEKAKYYLGEDKKDLRQQMKKAALERAKKDHTWFCRFRKIFERLELNNYSKED